MRSALRLGALAGITALMILAVPALGEMQAELVLIDGRVLRGVDVRREGGEYVLVLESGDEITLPMELVERVRMTQKEERSTPARNPAYRVGEPQTLAGEVPRGPTGMRSGAAETLAGTQVRAPSRSEQLAVFGEPSKFQKNIVDNTWVPTTDWNMDPHVQNNFAPSKWVKAPIDSTWQPESAFDPDEDVLKSSRSTWSKSIVDSSWKPTDGFKTSVSRP